MKCPHCGAEGYTATPAELFALNLRTVREALGMTQMDLAEKTGIHNTKISMIENASRVPHLGDVAQICAVLDISYTDMIGDLLTEDDVRKRKILET